MEKIILASKSPRREEILGRTGLKFEIAGSEYEEDMSLDLEPLELAKELSKGKAEDVARKYVDHIIIGADTFVVLGEKVLGKPFTEENAKKMLSEISGKELIVITGYTIIDSETGKTVSNAVSTKVFIKELTTDEIENYVATKEPLDKAGAFAIQSLGALIVKRIEGDYHNVMGLPIHELAESLKKFGINIL